MVGALTVAEAYYDWAYVAGTSAGAIVASLVAAGYTAEEIKEKVFSIDYKKFEDADSVTQMPFFGPFFGLKFNLGIFKGSYIEHWMRENLKAKGIERFGDLAVAGKSKGAGKNYRLKVIASDISTGKMLVLPNDIAQYGIDPDYLEVAKAVRMSISIPFFFQPVVINYSGAEGSRELSYIVDGGVLSNFPVWIFDENPGIKHTPTIGFRLMGPNTGKPNRIIGPISMLKALFGTMMEAHDNKFIEEKSFGRTISIPTLGIGATDFGITKEQAKKLFFSGVQAAEQFFGGWDYQRFLIKHVW